MKFYRKGSGEKYTPLDHFDMTTQVIFNPETGSRKANCTLSTLEKGSGSSDEVHPNSDQIFYVLTGTLNVLAKGVLLGTAGPGDAVLVTAGDVHAASNDGEEACSYLAITVPPLEKTH
jgi:quercetin dioxygenase-like cupin family protein